MTRSTSEVAACCSSASCNSWESRATSASRSVAEEPRRTPASGVLPRLGITVLRCCDLAPSGPTLERRLIALPWLDGAHHSGLGCIVHHSNCRVPTSPKGLGRLKTKSDLVVMPSGRQIFAFFALRMTTRSEEHTSELQSPCNLVCRLL